MHLSLPAFRLFIQQLSQANNQENIRNPYDRTIVTKSSVTDGVPSQKASICGKRLNVLTSSSPVDLQLVFWPWWRHQMDKFSALLALCAGNSPVPVTSPHKDQWRRTLMWVHNREAGDLRRHRGHYDVNVMAEYFFKPRTFISRIVCYVIIMLQYYPCIISVSSKWTIYGKSKPCGGWVPTRISWSSTRWLCK